MEQRHTGQREAEQHEIDRYAEGRACHAYGGRPCGQSNVQLSLQKELMAGYSPVNVLLRRRRRFSISTATENAMAK